MEQASRLLSPVPAAPWYCTPGCLCWQTGPRNHCLKALVPLCLQQLLQLLVVNASKQAPELLLPTGLVLPCMQQLLWFLEIFTCQAGPRTPAAHRLCSPVTAAATVGPGRPCPSTNRRQGLCCKMIQVCWLCCPMGTLNLLLSARSPPTHMQVNPRFHSLLICWHQKASLPIVYGGPVLTTNSSCGRVLAAPSKSRNPDPQLSGNLPLCR
jgi:hypothetical protein